MPRRRNPQLTLDLSHLSEAECDKIVAVLQKDFEIRAKEKERLSRKKKDVQEDDRAANLLVKKQVFNEKNCMRCYSMFIVIFNPRYICFACRFNVCKKCCTYVSDFRNHVCNTCLKERDVMAASCEWFYDNVRSRFRHFGSAKVVKYLHSTKSDSTDTAASSGRAINHSTRGCLIDAFDKAVLKTDELEALDALDVAATGSSTSGGTMNNDCLHDDVDNHLLSRQRSLASSTASHKGADSGLGESSTTHSKSELVQQKIGVFQIRIESVLHEMRIELREKVTPEIPVQGTDRDCDLLIRTYRDRVAQIVANFAQLLYVAYESFDDNQSMSKSTEDMHQEVQNIIQQQVEKIVNYEVDSFLDDTASIVSEDESNVGLREHRIENRLAQAIVQKVLDDHSIYLEQQCILTEQANHRQKVEMHLNFQHPADQQLVTDEEMIMEEQQRRVNRAPALPDFQMEDDSDMIAFRGAADDSGSSNDLELEMEHPSVADPLHHSGTTSSIHSQGQFSNSWSGNWLFTGDKNKTGVSTNIQALHTGNSAKVGDRDASVLSDLGSASTSSSDDYALDVSTIKRKPKLASEQGGESSDVSTDFDDIYVTNLEQKEDVSIEALQQAQKRNKERKRELKKKYRKDKKLMDSKNTTLQAAQNNKSSMGIWRPDNYSNEHNDPCFVNQPREISVKRGECGTVEVKLEGSQPIDVFWYRLSDSQMTQISESKKYDIHPSDTQHLSPSQTELEPGCTHSLRVWETCEDDEGEYLCVAVGPEDRRASQSFKLNVVENPEPFKKPEFLVKFEDCEVEEGVDAKFKCKVRGYPAPRVSFLREGREIFETSGRFQITKIGVRAFILTVLKACWDDDAEYACVLRNCAGEARCEAQLQVREKETQSKSEVEQLKQKLEHTRNSTEQVAHSTFTAAGNVAELHRELDAVDQHLNEIQTDISRPAYALRSVTNQMTEALVKAESSTNDVTSGYRRPSQTTASLIIKKHPASSSNSSEVKNGTSVSRSSSLKSSNPVLGTYPPNQNLLLAAKTTADFAEPELQRNDSKRFSGHQKKVEPVTPKTPVIVGVEKQKEEVEEEIYGAAGAATSLKERILALEQRVREADEPAAAATTGTGTSPGRPRLPSHPDEWKKLEAEVVRTMLQCSEAELEVERISKNMQEVFPEKMEVDASSLEVKSELEIANEELKTRENNFKELQNQFKKETKGFQRNLVCPKLHGSLVYDKHLRNHFIIEQEAVLFQRVASITGRTLTPAQRERAQALRSETSTRREIRSVETPSKRSKSETTTNRRPATPVALENTESTAPTKASTTHMSPALTTTPKSSPSLPTSPSKTLLQLSKNTPTCSTPPKPSTTPMSPALQSSPKKVAPTSPKSPSPSSSQSPTSPASSQPGDGRLMSPAMDPSNKIVEFPIKLRKTGRELREVRHDSALVKSSPKK